jgi:glutathione peroxidase
MSNSLYDFTVDTIENNQFSFSQLKGKVVLIVNTASKCGFTAQYAGLEALYRNYKAEGLIVIGFPCNQFAHQEPGSAAEIAEFCSLTYGVSFPMMAKVDVNGKTAHSLYRWLRKQAPDLLGDSIKWNFTKFLVGKDGKTVKRFAPTVEPESLKNDIEHFLS